VKETVLKKISKDIWVVEQSQKYNKLEVGTRMTVIRLKDDHLMLISPINLSQALISAIGKLGVVSFIIAPNLMHHLYLNACAKLFPSALVYVASGLEEKYKDLANLNILAKTAPKEWVDCVEQQYFHGFAVMEFNGPRLINEVVFLHKSSQTLILTDTAYNIGSTSPFLTKAVTMLLGSYNKLGPTLAEKLASKDKALLLSSYRKIIKWPFEKVIMAHGEIVENNGKAKFIKGYNWLL
jgi:hypothetical protein